MFTDQNESDNYSTDKMGWEMLKPYIPRDKVIWSPFYSDGKMKEYFAEMGINIIQWIEVVNRDEIVDSYLEHFKVP